ncbi:MAG: hypothetical protein ACI3XJ_02180 [Oscillospiraceae bacterium]
MISKALFKRDLKISWKLWLVITAVMVLLLFALFFATSGMDGSGAMVIQQFYTLFAALIPVFFIGTTGTKLIAAQVDNGSFSYVMSAPLKRRTVAFTQAFFLILSVAVMYVLFLAVGLISFFLWGEVLEGKVFFLLTFGSLLFNLMVSGIAYFATCLFNSSGAATSVGTGLPLVFFLLHIVATFFGGNQLLSFCKYFTINSLYSPADIIACSSDMVLQFLVMAAAAAVLFLAGMAVFRKKDLPL